MTKMILAYELLEVNVPKSHIAKHLGVPRRTVIRWSNRKNAHGSREKFLEEYRQAKKGPRKKQKTGAAFKRRIWAIREKHHDC